MEIYNGKELFADNIENGNEFRRDYLDSLNRFIENGFDAARKEREDFMPPEKLKENPEAYREQYRRVIGFPTALYERLSNVTPAVKKVYAGEDDFGTYYRLSIEVMPDFWYYGIFMLPKTPHFTDGEKLPLIIAQHGGGGTPESCSDMAGPNNYDRFTKRSLERGFAVFAPTLLVWRFNINTGETFPYVDIPFDRGALDHKLKQLGYSITGMEVFCIMRSLDYLFAHEPVDGTKVGMMGLSYGGYFSLYTAACDTRIKATYACGFFNDRAHECFGDWGYAGSAKTFHDAEVAGLCAPRYLELDVGKTDPVFHYETSIEEAERVRPYYAVYGAEDKFRYDLWEGGHRFDEDHSGFAFFFDGILA